VVNSVLTEHIASILDLRLKIPVINVMGFLLLLGVNFEAEYSLSALFILIYVLVILLSLFELIQASFICGAQNHPVRHV